MKWCWWVLALAFSSLCRRQTACSSTKLIKFVPCTVALRLRPELEFAFEAERNEESGTSNQGGGDNSSSASSGTGMTTHRTLGPRSGHCCHVRAAWSCASTTCPQLVLCEDAPLAKVLKKRQQRRVEKDDVNISKENDWVFDFQQPAVTCLAAPRALGDTGHEGKERLAHLHSLKKKGASENCQESLWKAVNLAKLCARVMSDTKVDHPHAKGWAMLKKTNSLDGGSCGRERDFHQIISPGYSQVRYLHQVVESLVVMTIGSLALPITMQSCLPRATVLWSSLHAAIQSSPTLHAVKSLFSEVLNLRSPRFTVGRQGMVENNKCFPLFSAQAFAGVFFLCFCLTVTSLCSLYQDMLRRFLQSQVHDLPFKN